MSRTHTHALRLTGSPPRPGTDAHTPTAASPARTCPLTCHIREDRRSGTDTPETPVTPAATSAHSLTRRLRATMSGVSLWQFLRPLSAPLRTSVRTSGRSPRPDAECSAELPEYICAFTLAPCCGRGGAGQDHRQVPVERGEGGGTLGAGLQ